MVIHNYIFLDFGATWALRGHNRSHSTGYARDPTGHARLATGRGRRACTGRHISFTPGDGEGGQVRQAIIVFHRACTLTDRAPPTWRHLVRIYLPTYSLQVALSLLSWKTMVAGLACLILCT